jgi:hypothetical protein
VRPSAAAKPAYGVQGELQRDGDVVTGWCWSADRPSARLTVGLRIDGAPVGAVVAARLRLDLVRDGVCDGYHGFTIALPSPVPAYSLIEAFERVTGQVIGRLTSGEAVEISAWTERAAVLSETVTELHAKLKEHACSTPLAQVMRHAGRSLSRFERTGPALPRLPQINAPAFSLVLDGSSGAASEWKTAVIRLAPLLRHHRAELVVIGRGGETEGTDLIWVRAAGCAAEAWQVAAATARGERLVFLQPAETSAAGVARLLGIEPGTTLLGAQAVAAARAAGLSWTMPELARGTASTGLALLVDRSALHEAGGFDAGMDDGAGLHLIDLGLRLLRDGHRLASWAAVAREVRLTPTRPLVRARFAAHWDRSSLGGT